MSLSRTTAARRCAGHVDVLIIGARAAGAATALLLARAGLRVLVVDKSAYGSDTVSTHALMRPAVEQLQRWGVLSAVQAAGTPPVRRTTFYYGEDSVPVDIRPSHGVDALYAPRRTVLDAALVDAARAAGAEVRHGWRFEGVEVDAAGRVRGARLRDPAGQVHGVRSAMLVGADGIASPVARAVGAPVYRRGAHASAVLFAYWDGLPPDGYHWFFGEGVSAGLIPTNHGQVCVFAATAATAFDTRGGKAAAYRDLLARGLGSRHAWLDDARQAETLRGFAGVHGILRQAAGPGWALVGDAGYFRDPVTAHGLSDALRDAELLAGAILEGEAGLAGYTRRRDAVCENFFAITDAIAAHDWTATQAQALHLRLAEAAKPELAMIRGFATYAYRMPATA